jgi:hypothetical protein
MPSYRCLSLPPSPPPIFPHLIAPSYLRAYFSYHSSDDSSTVLLLCLQAVTTKLLPGLRCASGSTISATATTQLQVEQFPCLSDNYGYLIHDPSSGLTAAIDTPEVSEVV